MISSPTTTPSKSPASVDLTDILFISERSIWPLDQGFCIHGYHMASALRDQGRRVRIASHEPLPEDSPTALKDMSVRWPEPSEQHFERFIHGWRGKGSAARRRLARYQGSDLRLFSGVVSLVERYQPSTVIALGQHGPLMLKGLRDYHDTKRIWYAADELIYFQLSCIRREPIKEIPGRLAKIALYTGLESLFSRGLDGAIGVSPLDSKLLRRVGGVRQAVTIRNGVNMDYFRPNAAGSKQPVKPRSLVFWGRMDFEPNVDAVLWFAQKIWPHLLDQFPDAQWQIVGKNPLHNVRKLAELPGISVPGEVPDIRPYAHSATITILPIRCGGGIKNKLLEAAAMGRPMVASAKAIKGLELESDLKPAIVCQSPNQWVEAIGMIWNDSRLADQLGQEALKWVRKHHTWHAAAQQLTDWLDTVPAKTS